MAFNESQCISTSATDAGNITSRKEYARTYGEKGELLDTVVYTYGDAEWGDLLTAYDGVALTYDGIGNLTDDGTWEYTWEHGRELASMSDGETTWTYTYDANGMRTSRASRLGTYRYYYDGGTLTRMEFSSYMLQFDSVEDTVTMNGTLYYYVRNLQGDVVAITDMYGDPVVYYTYDAWGNVLSITGSKATTLGALNPLRYRGYVFDQDTGLYYLQSRYYNPEWGRFINADGYTSTGQGTLGNNMFAYCGNNPVSRADDGGEFWHIVIGAAVGAAIGALVTGVTSYYTDGQVDWTAVGLSALSGAASGALAATGAGIGVMIAGNAAISMAENAATQVIENEGFDNFDVGSMLIDGAIGAAFGAIGGPGNGSKHLTKLGTQTVKRTWNTTVHHGLAAGWQEAKKAFTYYGKNTVKYYTKYFDELWVDGLSAVGEELVNYYAGCSYKQLVGG